jgi:hypothetical protein
MKTPLFPRLRRLFRRDEPQTDNPEPVKEDTAMNPIPKNPFASKTIWGAIIGAAALLGRLVGVDVPIDEVQGVIDLLAANWTTIADTVALVLVIWGRVTAKQAIAL